MSRKFQRKANTNCQFCQEPLYRRPIQITNSKYLVCGKCRGKANSNIATAKNKRDYQVYIEQWKQGLVSGMRGINAISLHIRRYLFEKYENACCKCGWSEINPTTGKIPLEVNHLDGDHENNLESNLELICPNCHSLTNSYRGLNKGHGRPRY